MDKTIVMSLGGSIVAPDGVDAEFLSIFRHHITSFLEEHDGVRLILVVGGGGPARRYQQAFRTITGSDDHALLDWIGIAATRLNAELLRALFHPLCADPVVTDPTAEIPFTGRILVASGWKPGFSTDFDAVLLAERFGARTLLNLSNIAMVYSDDPRTNPDATPLPRLSWKEFRAMVGDEWTPGKNVPFDPVAARKAHEGGLSVIIAAGKDIENLSAILEGRPFRGTVIES
ncbi:UMP kinase [Spirochaeta thermophila]|uniref:Uridylate kinase n=1 Tax=Winmispira thermophila (strain ATCC 49972 / DSM 6192 / RI 19.B1) TaxID=665571 RepID=E0RR81_WINT6|nr:UMP kinase [Spirochaeta thermophila]ADN03058.1 hypothetical protein STHERM_c21270 [Spirochaeta thermophila DSM 6192]